MRVYDRKGFLALPEGVIFCKGQPWAFDTLMVKGETMPTNDFTYLDLCDIVSFDSGDWFARLEDSLQNGTSYPMGDDYGRDGTFSETDVFLVFEPDDLRNLIAFAEAALPTPPKENKE
ncbi:hypothetical protein [Nitratireductor indicus]|uniref:hypothetical protein n=1 Tax=Nitratireductor indicus TaxID=721133 RepID=UPI0028758383|nr:hypothetical protein [Nitratireductor indicus]MDS1138566.1 hypothetical protein [Nitratireductor indicus]